MVAVSGESRMGQRHNFIVVEQQQPPRLVAGVSLCCPVAPAWPLQGPPEAHSLACHPNTKSLSALVRELLADLRAKPSSALCPTMCHYGGPLSVRLFCRYPLRVSRIW